ncbi:MAG: aspartate carbamoyltransferase, partial [Thermoprotei archaeon]
MAQGTEVLAWRNRDVIDILGFTKGELLELFSETDKFVEGNRDLMEPLKHKVIATAFFEPSTRTRLSFSSAALRLGAKVIDLSAEASSLMKGESFADTIRMLEAYSDLIVVRHPSEGAALFASEISSKPVVNGGDGSQHHPTQAMLDVYTVNRLKGGVDGLTYALVGDIKYARTATSFLYALTKFKPEKVYAVCPDTLRPRVEVLKRLESLGLRVDLGVELEDVVGEVDVVYV